MQTDTVLDTGFNGTLTLQSSTIADLGLSYSRRGLAFLSEGSESLFDVYEAFLIWNGTERRISVDEADTDPLVGMTDLYGCKLTVEAVDGGIGMIKAIL